MQLYNLTDKIINTLYNGKNRYVEIIKEESFNNGMLVSFERFYYTNNKTLNKKDLLYKKIITRFCISNQILESNNLNSVKDIMNLSIKLNDPVIDILNRLSLHTTKIELELPFEHSTLLGKTYYGEYPIRVLIGKEDYSSDFFDFVVFRGRKIETAENCILGNISDNDKKEISTNIISLYKKEKYLQKEENILGKSFEKTL